MLYVLSFSLCPYPMHQNIDQDKPCSHNSFISLIRISGSRLPIHCRNTEPQTLNRAILKQRKAIHVDFGQSVTLAVLHNVLDPRLNLLFPSIGVGLKSTHWCKNRSLREERREIVVLHFVAVLTTHGSGGKKELCVLDYGDRAQLFGRLGDLIDKKWGYLRHYCPYCNETGANRQISTSPFCWTVFLAKITLYGRVLGTETQNRAVRKMKLKCNLDNPWR